MTESLKGYYAGFISRLLAFSVDIIIIVVVLIFGGWLFKTASSFFTLGFLESFEIEYQDID